MSNLDVNTSQPEQGPRPSRPESYEQHGVDVSEVFRDERLNRRSEGDLPSAREGADEIIRRRSDTQPKKDQRDVEQHVEVVRWDDEGTPSDPRSSATLSDTRTLAESLAQRREDRKAYAAQYLQEHYGTENEQGAAAEPTAEQQQAYEQELIAQQVRAQQAEAAAAQQRQAEAERVRQQQAAEFEQTRQNVYLQQVADDFQNRFPELVGLTEADVLALQQTDPAKYTKVREWQVTNAAAIQALNGQYQQQAQAYQQQQQAQAYQQQWQNFCQSHDNAFIQAHPEINDPKVHYEVQREALEVLKEQGMSEEQIAHEWRTNPTFRSIQAQELLYTAVKHRRAERAAKDISSKQRLPPVSTVRPGVSRDRSWVDEDRLRALSDRLGETKSVRAAAELLRARRAASR